MVFARRLQPANKPNKLSFRARQLDVSKPMPIYMSEDLSDLAETTEIKRAVPQMPTGMEKDEECEHHLQRAIVTGTVIPTPEVNELDKLDMYLKTYCSARYHMPKQLVRMHPFALEQEAPEYDADSEDEEWLSSHGDALNIDIDKFEAIIDKLDKNSNFSVITLPESKSLLKENNDDVVTAVYDYWLSKRLRLQHSLIPTVKTEAGMGPANDPYIAFRRRKDKMQTRKNRKNDETSYEKMLKLKKDLSCVFTLFQLLQKRENAKLQMAKLHEDIYKKRFEARDFNGALLNEVKSLKRTQLYTSLSASLAAATMASAQSQSHHQHQQQHQSLSWAQKAKELKKPFVKQTTASSYYMDDSSPTKKERRPYKRRKRQRLHNGSYDNLLVSSDEEKSAEGSPTVQSSSGAGVADENPFSFKRQKNCSYLAPRNDELGWDYDVDEMCGNENRRFYSAYVSVPRLRGVGFVRRRLGRGGRVILDRTGYTMDDIWSKLDYTVNESGPPVRAEFAKYKPKSPLSSSSDETDEFFYESDESTDSVKPLLEIENLMHSTTAIASNGSGAGKDKTCLEIEFNNPLKKDSTYAMLDHIITCMDNASAKARCSFDGSAIKSETNGSILDRWAFANKDSKACKPVSSFYLGPDADQVGCSSFRTCDYSDALAALKSDNNLINVVYH